MDIFAHFFWSFAMYWQHPKRWIAGLIGMMPDLFAFTIPFITNLFGSGVQRGPPSHVQSYVHTLYSISHSLIIFAIAAVLFWLLWREAFWLLGGWLLHIVIDIPTHTGTFFPTPFLWPLSDYTLSGVSWGTGWFMLANYALIIATYSWLLWKVPGPARGAVKSG